MSATSRFLLEPAPGGLVLVQDLVNTRPVAPYGVRDLLGTVADAQRWSRRGAVRRGRSTPHATGGVRRITSADLPALRRLRREVERAVSVTAGRPRDAGTAHADRRRRRACPAAAHRDRRAVAGRRAVWGEVLLAQRDGRWERLKVCRNPECPCAFYDASRNNSRVWHDVRTCGNVANLRASRARRRAASA